MSPAQKIIRLIPIYVITGIIIVLSYNASKTEIREFQSPLSIIPEQIGPWKGEDLDEKSAIETFFLQDSTAFRYLVRHYKHFDNEKVITLSALEDLKGTQREIHDPRLCYESRGWTVLSNNKIQISPDNQSHGDMKLISYTNKEGSIRRTEIFGYLVDDTLIISEIALRLSHIMNRLKTMVGKPIGNIIYLNVSVDIGETDEQQKLEDLKYIMGKILLKIT